MRGFVSRLGSNVERLRFFASAVFAALLLLNPAAARAQTPSAYPAPPVYPAPYAHEIPDAAPLQFEVGARFWYASGGRFQKTLYDTSGAQLLSRLTWTGETGKSGEGYFNVTDKGVFLKGYLGIGRFSRGNLQDEDFPPFPPPFAADPYSSTNSAAGKGDLSYGSIDLGYYPLATADAKLGGFVGYHFYQEKMNAFGCTQEATNPDFCVPSIPNSVLVLTQKNNWHSLRVGAAGEVTIAPGLKLSGDAAYLPYVKLAGADTHWLRLGIDFNGPTPETGHGTGMQFEGVVSYAFNEYLTVGAGGRYWRMQVPNGLAHFEDSVIGGASPQVEKFQTNRYGAFVQVGLKY